MATLLNNTQEFVFASTFFWWPPKIEASVGLEPTELFSTTAYCSGGNVITCCLSDEWMVVNLELLLQFLS